MNKTENKDTKKTLADELFIKNKSTSVLVNQLLSSLGITGEEIAYMSSVNLQEYFSNLLTSTIKDVDCSDKKYENTAKELIDVLSSKNNLNQSEVFFILATLLNSLYSQYSFTTYNNDMLDKDAVIKHYTNKFPLLNNVLKDNIKA